MALFPQVLAEYDDDGIYVYQAFKDNIVDAALKKGTFGEGFSLDRMTWIKPSFGWMLYRSGYATKKRQTRILKVKMTHEGFQEVLRRGVPTHYDPLIFDDEVSWGRALTQGEVRYQWDPERDLRIQKTGGRAIQLGIKGSMVERYVNEWIVGLEDYTRVAHDISEAIKRKRKLPHVIEPRVYPVSDEIARALGIRDQPVW